jgi:hypothetical protein
MLMNDQLSMFDLMNYEDIRNAISSQESADGHTHCSLPDGQAIDQSGQEVAHASRSAAQETKKEKQTNGICGLSGSTSFASADLQRCLENRLRQRLPMGGLTMFIKDWKRKVTPSGRPYCQLAVSARPISGTDCGLWPTPQARDYRTGESHRANNPDRSNNLNDFAAMAMWPTPSQRDHKDTPGMSKTGTNPDGSERNRMDQLGRVVFGSTAQTGSKGSLNPRFASWLMGYPTEWENCGGTVTLSSRKSPRSGSPRI